MSTIDQFKYKALLAELESIKGTKKPVSDFINKIYELSNQFSTYDPEFHETARYAFILITKAITYNNSNIKIKASLNKQAQDLARLLIAKSIVTIDNIVETFEFYNDTISFYPESVKILPTYEVMINLLKDTHSINFTTYQLAEFKGFYNSNPLISLYIKSVFGKDCIFFKYMRNPSPIKATTVEDLENIINVLQITLKEVHEQLSSNGTTV